MATMEAALERWFVSAPDPLRQKIRDWRAACDAQTYAGTAWTLANGVVELTGSHQPKGLPTHVLTCENDVAPPLPWRCRLQKIWRLPPPLIIPSLKHLGLLERPKPFIDALLDFLNKT